MKLFNFKKKKDLQKNIELIRKIEIIDSNICSNRLYTISILLKQIINQLDNKDLILTDFQFDTINNSLDTISNHASKGFEELLSSKCNLIISIIKNDLKENEINLTVNDNEEKIYKLIGEQTELTEQIEILTNKMNEALGKDKGKWLLYDMQKKMLYNKMAIIAKNYNTILSAQSNLVLIDDIKKAKTDAETILAKNEFVDPNELEDNISVINQTNIDIQESTNKINDIFVKNFGVHDFSDDYEKALNQKVLEENEIEKNKNGTDVI